MAFIHFTALLSSCHASPSRVRCQECTETCQGQILTHRALKACQTDAPQEERVCHDFKPISARSSFQIHHGTAYDRSDGSALVPLTWWQQHGYCATHPICWAEKHQPSRPCPRFQSALSPKTPLQEQLMDSCSSGTSQKEERAAKITMGLRGEGITEYGVQWLSTACLASSNTSDGGPCKGCDTKIANVGWITPG